MDDLYRRGAELLRSARHIVAFTGAGISVESGIPPFRGPTGLWSRYDPRVLDIDYFRSDPRRAWLAIKALFYDFFGQAKPNAAHRLLAAWEERGLLAELITQNIDGLHQDAGSRRVEEFHGSLRELRCDRCGERVAARAVDLGSLPPRCASCGGVLRPDFVFFGEPIPETANAASFRAAETADLFLVIGTSGEVMPASLLPRIAKRRGAAVMEINPEESAFSRELSDLYLPDRASLGMERLEAALAEG